MVIYAGGIGAHLSVTPSLAYMAEATRGWRVIWRGLWLYNVAWAFGLLVGPALGGFLYETMGFTRLSSLGAGLIVMRRCVRERDRGERDTTRVAGGYTGHGVTRIPPLRIFRLLRFARFRSIPRR